MGNKLCGGMSKEEKERRAEELRKNVVMTEHQVELHDLVKKFDTSVDMVRLFFEP